MTPALETCEALARLHAEAFAGVERAWSTPEFASLMATPGVTITGDDGGFVVLRVAADEAEILTLAVRPGARQVGRGRALVEDAARVAAEAGATRLLLEVAEDNAAARALYASTDFVEIGRRRAYYARPDGPAVDALILSHDLSAGSPAASPPGRPAPR